MNRLRMGVITDDVSNYSMQCYINAGLGGRSLSCRSGVLLFVFAVFGLYWRGKSQLRLYPRCVSFASISCLFQVCYGWVVSCSVSDMFSKELMRRDGDNCQCLLVVSDINMRYQLLMEAIQVMMGMRSDLLEGFKHHVLVSPLPHRSRGGHALQGVSCPGQHFSHHQPLAFLRHGSNRRCVILFLTTRRVCWFSPTVSARSRT